MQDHFHHVQELHEVEIWLLWYRFRFTSTRAHGVPFLHTPGAHLTTPFHGAIAVGAMLPPTPPSMGIRREKIRAVLLSVRNIFIPLRGRTREQLL